jgi:hypothetical protein
VNAEECKPIGHLFIMMIPVESTHTVGCFSAEEEEGEML